MQSINCSQKEARSERASRPRFGVDPGPDSVRGPRAIQRSIKGAEYFSTSGPSLGSTPKDILHVRDTMNLYHYRPIADESIACRSCS
jgi:hypothetical protein